MNLTIKNAVFIIYTGNDYVSIEDRNQALKDFNDNVDSPIQIIAQGITGDQSKAKQWNIIEGNNITQEDINTLANNLTTTFKGLRLTVKDNDTNQETTNVYYRDTRDSELKVVSYQEWVSN